MNVENLKAMAALAAHRRKPGFRECVCLPDGTYTVFEIERSVSRADGSYWLIWRQCRRSRTDKQQPAWVTSTSMRKAMPYADWLARADRTASLL